MVTIRVKLGSIVCRGHGGQELGAGEGEAGLELRQLATGHLVHLLGVVLLPQSGVEALVDSLGVQGDAERQEDVHLVRLLVDLVVLVALHSKHGLGALHIQQNVGECPNGVRVAPHHHIGKANVVIGGYLTTRHPGVEGLLVQLNVFQNLGKKGKE